MKLKLRDYQQETLLRLLENERKGIQRNLAVLATGLGKTFIATEFHKAYKPQEKTIFLVDRIELAYQAQESFKRSNSNLRVGLEMNKHHASREDDIVIACVDTIGRKGSFRIGKFTPEHFTKVVVDEAHVSISDKYTRVLNYLGVGPDNLLEGKLLLGLTATPNRTDGRGLSSIYDDIVVNYDIRFGISEGWLTDIDVLQIHTGVDISNVKATKNDFDLTQLGQALNIRQRNELIYKAYDELSKEESALIYASTVAHAYSIMDLFNANGVSCFCIEANTKSKERKEAIELYKKGEIKVLTNYGTLTTGFDAPETSSIILARPLRSELLFRQIIGRGLRPSKFSFVNQLDTTEQRLQAISDSVKPACKIIDLHDLTGQHRVASIPSLFGLNDKLIIPNRQEKFFQEVVEPLEEIERDKGVDIARIVNLNEIDMIVKQKKMNITDLEVSEDLKQHTDKSWFKVNDGMYQVVYSRDGKRLLVKQNGDTFDLIEYDKKTKLNKKLQSFFDLSAAIKLGDEYAQEFYKYHEGALRDQSKKTEPPSARQAQFLKQLYKGGVREDKYKTYEGTNVKKLYYRRTGQLITAESASQLIAQRIT